MKLKYQVCSVDTVCCTVEISEVTYGSVKEFKKDLIELYGKKDVNDMDILREVYMVKGFSVEGDVWFVQYTLIPQ